jgi:hypothetical protein
MHDPNFVRSFKPWCHFFNLLQFYNSTATQKNQDYHDNRSLMHVSWKAPPSGWHCLNILDGAAKITNKVACYGGVLSDDNGRWVAVL